MKKGFVGALAGKAKGFFSRKPDSFCHLMIYTLVIGMTLTSFNLAVLTYGKDELSTFYVLSSALTALLFSWALILNGVRMIFHKERYIVIKIPINFS